MTAYLPFCPVCGDPVELDDDRVLVWIVNKNGDRVIRRSWPPNAWCKVCGPIVADYVYPEQKDLIDEKNQPL